MRILCSNVTLPAAVAIIMVSMGVELLLSLVLFVR